MSYTIKKVQTISLRIKVFGEIICKEIKIGQMLGGDGHSALGGGEVVDDAIDMEVNNIDCLPSSLRKRPARRFLQKCRFQCLEAHQ